MNQYLKSTKTVIKEKYEFFTQVEKVIADYFLAGDIKDFSIKGVANKLFVSEASLSRFAKKMGFKGYREFVFSYNANLNESNRLGQLTEFTIHKYQEVLERTYQIVDNNQMIRVAKLLDSSRRVFVYGVGSNLLVAREFCSRFIRLGLDVEALNGGGDIVLNLPRVTSDCLVLGISISGSTAEVMDGLRAAHKKGATTVLLTSVVNATNDEFTDETIKLAHMKNITVSHIISPQLPALIMMDIIYTHYLNHNKSDKLESLKEILDQIDYKFEK